MISTPATRMHFKLSTTLPSKIHLKASPPAPWESMRGKSTPHKVAGGKKAKKIRPSAVVL